MIYNKNLKVFGPRKHSLSYLSGPVYQRGEGFGSFISNIFRKVIPLASKVVKKITPVAVNTLKKVAKSDLVKDTTKQLSQYATTAAADALADVVSGVDPGVKAHQTLQQARADIADTIRKRGAPREDVHQKQHKSRKRKKVSLKTTNRKKTKWLQHI